MRLPGFVKVRSLSRVLGWCLCLVLLALINVGATQSVHSGVLPAQSAAGGSPPVIQVFKVDPALLDTATSFAVYTFKVKGATDVQMNEADVNIKNISNSSGATLQGTANGNPASSISTDENGQFMCTIMAANPSGSVQAELQLSLAKELLPESPPVGTAGNQTENKSRWLEQRGIQTRIPPVSSTTNPTEPDFFECPESCKYCLQPGDAASLGFTQRCSDQRCFYDTKNSQSWYCYSEPEGWCCANQQVNKMTRSECARLQGYWSTNQYEALDACQPRGYCCISGQIYYPVTESDCRLKGGSYWSTSQAQTAAFCQQQQTCWCCVKGQVFETTQDRCITAGGGCYSTQSQAAAACYQTQPPIRYPDIK